MERITQYAFYELGLAFAQLKELSGEVLARTALFPLLDANSKVQALISGQPIKLNVSLKAAKGLQDALGSVYTKYYIKDGKFDFPEDGVKVQAWEWNGIKSALETFEHVFRAEMDGSSVYAVPSRGIYSTPELVESAQDAFPPDLQKIMGDKAMADYNAAGRCIAFNLPTAAAFHAMRAVEAVIELYFQTFANKPGQTCTGWADYASELDKCLSNPPIPKVKPDKRSIDQIRQMKDADRNPVMHPRVTLTLPEADALFSAAKSVMMNMAMEVKEAMELLAEQKQSVVVPMSAPQSAA